MEDWDGSEAFAHYSSFSIDPENNGYQLHLGNYMDGNAGDHFYFKKASVPINIKESPNFQVTICDGTRWGGFLANFLQIRMN